MWKDLCIYHGLVDTDTFSASCAPHISRESDLGSLHATPFNSYLFIECLLYARHCVLCEAWVKKRVGQ